MISLMPIAQKLAALVVVAIVFLVTCLFVGNYYTDWNLEPLLIGIAIVAYGQPRLSEVLPRLLNINRKYEDLTDDEKIHIELASGSIMVLLMILAFLLVLNVIYPCFS